MQSILIVILSGAFRVMLKHYPWDRISIFIYKLNRAYGFLVFIAIQLVQTYSDLGSGETTAGLPSLNALSPSPKTHLILFRGVGGTKLVDSYHCNISYGDVDYGCPN